MFIVILFQFLKESEGCLLALGNGCLFFFLVHLKQKTKRQQSVAELSILFHIRRFLEVGNAQEISSNTLT